MDVEKLLISATNSFVSEKDINKFEALESILFLLITCEENNSNKNAKIQLISRNPTWQFTLREELLNLLKCKLDEQQRSNTLHLSTILLQWFGKEWLNFSSEKTTIFIELLLQLSRIEIFLYFGGYENNSVNVVEESNVIQFKSFSSVQILLSSFEIIENIIELLISEEESLEKFKFKSEELLRIKDILKDIFQVFINYLGNIIPFVTSKQGNEQDNQFIEIIIRILSIWICNETEELNSEILNLTPFLLSYLKYKSSENLTSLLYHLFPALNEIIQYDNAIQYFIVDGGYKTLIQIFKKSQNLKNEEYEAILETLLSILMELSMKEPSIAGEISSVITPYLKSHNII